MTNEKKGAAPERFAGNDREKCTVAVVSLGCVKNIIDTEVFLAAVAENGYVLTPHPEDADVVLVNTCAFVDDAVDESVDMLRELTGGGKGKRDAGRKVIAVGCLPQRMGETLFALVPGLSGAVGLDEERELSELIEKTGGKKRLFCREGAARAAPEADCPRLRITPPHYSYLRLGEGCNAGCTFCAIPKIRGRLRSKPQQKVLEEAEELASSGVKELVLVSQDLTAYGHDLEGKGNRQPAESNRALCELLKELEKTGGIEWIRLLYLHPDKITDALIDVIAESSTILSYLDLPFQHASPSVLKRMGRGGGTRVGGDKALGPFSLIERLKERIPGVVMRGTFLVGFPGETDDDFACLERFIVDAGFQRGGVFGWSPQKGTAAFDFKDRVDRRIVREREDRIRELIVQNAKNYAEGIVGTKFSVFVDEAFEDHLAARSFAEAPDVDPVFRLPPGSAQPGELVDVVAKAAEELDIKAEPVEYSWRSSGMPTGSIETKYVKDDKG